MAMAAGLGSTTVWPSSAYFGEVLVVGDVLEYDSSVDEVEQAKLDAAGAAFREELRLDNRLGWAGHVWSAFSFLQRAPGLKWSRLVRAPPGARYGLENRTGCDRLYADRGHCRLCGGVVGG